MLLHLQAGTVVAAPAGAESAAVAVVDRPTDSSADRSVGTVGGTDRKPCTLHCRH